MRIEIRGENFALRGCYHPSLNFFVASGFIPDIFVLECNPYGLQVFAKTSFCTPSFSMRIKNIFKRSFKKFLTFWLFYLKIK